MRIIICKEVNIERSIRVRQLESLFDVPAKEKLTFSLTAELPVEAKPWNIGLIVGPSGSGKTLTLRQFGDPERLQWSDDASTIDSVQSTSVDEITEAFQAVGFNTIPSWMRPFGTLSNGEQFRATLARVLVEGLERTKITDNNLPILMDEFTSVVDRQVAKIGAYAVSKYTRRHGLQFIAASCHYDIVEWLDPDWVFQPASCEFQWRELRRHRPSLEVSISRVPYATWNLFSPFHYLTPELNKAARCYGLYVGDEIAAFCGNLHRPHAKVNDIIGCSRAVTLPDWQGLGLVMVLLGKMGAAYLAIGKRFRIYPNHPAFVRSCIRSAEWRQVKESGNYSPRRGESSTVKGFGGRACAVFEYAGGGMTSEEANRIFAS